MSLVEYRRKRHFQKTSEPAGMVTKRRPKKARTAKAHTARKLKFVIQKHAARRLHYDFRLELDGVLLSWAVPKGPSFDPSEKRLAVHVEDHPLEYGKFEGRIPEGEYGAGEVIVWDRGTWTPAGDPREGLRRGKLEFQLDGEKLQGGWKLIRMHGRSGDDKNWLLMKSRDESARPLAEFDVTEEQPKSVKTGRRIEELQQHKSNGRTPRRSKSKRRSAKTKAEPLPDFVELQLATLVDKPPQGPNWLHEMKFDGYRLLVRLESGKATLLTRNNLDWTSKYPPVAQAVESLPAQTAILDGEVVALLETGVSSFQALQNALRRRITDQLVYYAFDLLYLNGHDLRSQPLEDRKSLLKELIAAGGHVQLQFSDHFDEDGQQFWDECCRRGLEGIISKRRDRPYIGGRTSDWLKIKCVSREELVIGGYTISPAKHRDFGSLLLGYFDNGQFIYSGRVGTGFDAAMLADVRQRLEKRGAQRSPFAQIPSRERTPHQRWVRPELVAQIEFRGWTDAGILRQASFQGLREDKPAFSVGRPESLPAAAHAQENGKPMAKTKTKRSAARRKKPAVTSRSKRSSGGSELPIHLTSPDRVLFADTGLTKLELARFYMDIADWILPHLAGRPIALLRCPEGQGEPCFFQKHAAAGTPDALRRIDIEEKNETEIYLIADDLPGLLSLAQMSVLEIHPWGSRDDRIEQPDRITFDLDPAEDVPWPRVVEAAKELRDMLAELGLTTFVKTTGGKGLHVVAPLAPRRHEWDAVKSFTQAVAQHFADEHPDRYVANMSKAQRKGKIFIDYLRNGRGATAVSAYSTRAKPGAPVATPLAWDELSPQLHSDHFRVDNLRERLKSLRRDPWQELFTIKQQLPKFVPDST
jgi:bifunctional non-homologous end joining protein LigD